MNILSIEINGKRLDLSDAEKIVQSFSLFDIDDITSRQAEYTNTFNVPKTTNNINIIKNSDYMNSTDEFPYSKVPAVILINEFPYKRGFIELEEIADEISLRFYSGNVGFYEFIKQRSLKDIDANNNPTLITNWTLFDVVNLRAETSGVIYPLINYNGMSDTGNVVDVRRLLPSYYKLSLLEAMAIDAGYTLQNDLVGDALTALQNDIVPTSSNKLEMSAEDIALASYSGTMEANTNDVEGRFFGNYNWSFSAYQNVTHDVVTGYKTHQFSTYASGNENLYYNFPNGLDYYKCNLGGEYTFDFDILGRAEFYMVWDSIPLYEWRSEATYFLTINGVIRYTIGTISIHTGQGNLYNVLAPEDTFTGSATINLNNGDICRIQSKIKTTIAVGNFQGVIHNTHYAKVFTKAGSSAGFTLNSGLVFGSQLNPSQCLPNIKQNDFLKDTCVRYCILPFVDEDNKIVYLKPFGDILDNIPNAVDWSDKVDETNEPKINFKIGDYAQRNLYKHKEDKFVPNIPYGSDSLFTISNLNLPVEKTIYESPFAPSETQTKLDTSEMIYIDLHDGNGFNNDIQPRTCYIRHVNRSIDYTDGTSTTSVTTDVPHTWFISDDRTYSAGWQKTLLTDYSTQLIGILQTPKVLTIDIRLTLIDILKLNYFYPVYLKQYNSYFFISEIEQFDYTSNDSTSVKLIRLI